MNSSNNIYGIRFNDDNQTITTVGSGILKFWRSNSNLKKTVLFLHGNLSPDGEISARLNANDIELTDLQKGSSQLLIGHRKSITSLSFSPDGTMLVSGSQDSRVKLWNIVKKTFQASDGSEVNNISFNSDGQIIASKKTNNTVQIWRGNDTLLTTLPGRNSAISFSKSSNHNLILASASQDRMVQLWRRNGTFLKTLHGEAVDGSFSPDGKTIALVKNDYSVELSTSDGKPISVFQGHKDQVYKISFSRDGQTIATISKDTTVKLWRRDGTLLNTLYDYGDQIESLGLSSNGKILAILLSDNTVKFLRQDGTLIDTLQGEGSKLMKMQFSPNGEILAILYQTDDTNKVQLRRIDGSLLRTLAIKNAVQKDNIFFSSNGEILAIPIEISNVKQVQLWHIDGTLLRTIPGKDEEVFNVVFSLDSQTLGIEYTTSIQVLQRNGTLLSTIPISDRLSWLDSQNLVTIDGSRVWLRRLNASPIEIIPMKNLTAQCQPD